MCIWNGKKKKKKKRETAEWDFVEALHNRHIFKSVWHLSLTFTLCMSLTWNGKKKLPQRLVGVKGVTDTFTMCSNPSHHNTCVQHYYPTLFCSSKCCLWKCNFYYRNNSTPQSCQVTFSFQDISLDENSRSNSKGSGWVNSKQCPPFAATYFGK